MKTKYYLIIILLALLPACSQKAQNENLPVGMQSGYWASEKENSNYSNYYNIGFLFFENGSFSDAEGKLGTYTLMDDNTILLQTSGLSERIVATMAKSGKRCVLSGKEMDDVVVDLIIPDTSSGDIKKDIVGTWEEYERVYSLDDDAGDGYLWSFKNNGSIVIVEKDSGDEELTGTYEFMQNKLILEFTNGETWAFPALSLGDLIYLNDQKSQNGIFLLKQ